jgi:hypothetical protein
MKKYDEEEDDENKDDEEKDDEDKDEKAKHKKDSLPRLYTANYYEIIKNAKSTNNTISRE